MKKQQALTIKSLLSFCFMVEKGERFRYNKRKRDRRLFL